MSHHRQPAGIPTGGQFAAGGQMRPTFHLTDDGSLGVDPEVGAAFAELGFDENEALDWSEAGFSADEAVTWRDLHGRHLSPTTASAYASHQVSASDALDYTARGVHDPRSVADFIEARIPGESAAAWQQALARIGVEDRYIGNAAADWNHNGFSVVEAQQWSAVGQLHPAHARDWRLRGFAPEEAASWERALFSAGEAADWRQEGFTPERADYFATRGFDARSAQRELATAA